MAASLGGDGIQQGVPGGRQSSKRVPGEFGELLRAHRLRAGLSQEALAERAALSPAAISALEHGRRRRPHPRTVSVLAEALELAPVERGGLLEAALRGDTHAPPPSDRPLQAAERAIDSPVPASPLSTTLPRQLTSFVGRQAELADIRRLLATTRLLTLIGSGGIGKTRLALEAAAADGHRDGAVFVDLAPLIDPALVPDTTLTALGVRHRPGLQPTVALTEALQSRQVLLVLDNCEHVVDAAAALADSLLRACPEVRVLATSRRPLAVAGEVVWRITALPLPDGGNLTPERALDSPAIRLFAERAMAAVPDFAVTDATALGIAEICRRLDGIPLAIELAAARVRVLGIDQIRERLDDRFQLLVSQDRLVAERQQTLRATLDWSYALLSVAERRLFAALAVFAGSWSLEAAEHVCGDGDLESTEVLRVLGNLVDHSLVAADRQEQGLVVRYRLLDTMREYATDRLAEAHAVPAMRDRHLGWYLAQAERVPLNHFDEGHLSWLATEYENLRVALRWAIDSGQIELGLRLATACAGYWQVRGSTAEGRRWLTELLDRGAGELNTPVGASALNMASQLAMVEWDIAAAQTLVERSLMAAERLGDRVLLGYAHMRRGIIVARVRNNLARAEAELVEALGVGRELGDGYLQVYCLYSLGLTVYSLGDLDRAEDLGRQLLALSQSMGHAWGMARAHRVLGQVALARGAREDATRHLQLSLAQSRALADVAGIVGAQIGLGQLAAEQSATLPAHAAFTEGLRLGCQLGDKLEIARALEGLAGLSVGSRPERAIYLLAGAQTVRARLGAEPYPAEQLLLHRWRTSARQALNARAYREAEQTGASAALDSLIAVALDPEAAPGSVEGKSPRSQSDANLRQDEDVLTARERQVTALIGRGLTNRELAERLGVTEGTARVHVGRVLAKLQLHSRATLATWAVRNGRSD